MPKEATEQDSPSPTGSLVEDIKKNLGIDIGDIAGTVAKDYVKENVFGKGRRPTSPRGKFGRTLEALKDAWWVPAAVYFSFMIALIGGKVLAKLAGVEI